jgi:DNA-directed RNA polymerase subunit H (RpoH/RPB5)
METSNNFLVPKHRKLSSDEINSILEKYKITDTSKLPKIKIKDPALAAIEIEAGDVIEITRHSFAGETKYYRVVIE